VAPRIPGVARRTTQQQQLHHLCGGAGKSVSHTGNGDWPDLGGRGRVRWLRGDVSTDGRGPTMTDSE
jgi:hypothetical protein